MKKLTDEQRSHAEENIRLAFYFSKKWINKLHHYQNTEEVESVCMLGLTKASKHFDKDKGNAFATFACRCIDNEVLMLLRKNKKHNYTIPVSSLNINDSDDREISLNEKLDLLDGAATEDHYDFIDHEFLNQLLKSLNEFEKELIQLRFIEEKGQHELASHFNISQSYVSRKINIALKKMKREGERLSRS